MPYGRQLRGVGLGLVPDTSVYGDSWAGQDHAARQAAQDDDVAGNGIFDGPGAPPTAHAGSGVFESHFGLPGYLYREVPTQPSEVLDTTTGMPIVYQPNAGGSWYEDVRETYAPFDRETPRLYATQPVMQSRRVPEVSRTTPMSGFGEAVAAPTMDSVKPYLPWVLGGALVGVGVAYLMKELGHGR